MQQEPHTSTAVTPCLYNSMEFRISFSTARNHALERSNLSDLAILGNQRSQLRRQLFWQARSLLSELRWRLIFMLIDFRRPLVTPSACFHLVADKQRPCDTQTSVCPKWHPDTLGTGRDYFHEALVYRCRVFLRGHICNTGAIGDWPKSKLEFWDMADTCKATRCRNTRTAWIFSLLPLVAEIWLPEVRHLTESCRTIANFNTPNLEAIFSLNKRATRMRLPPFERAHSAAYNRGSGSFIGPSDWPLWCAKVRRARFSTIPSSAWQNIREWFSAKMEEHARNFFSISSSIRALSNYQKKSHFKGRLHGEIMLWSRQVKICRLLHYRRVAPTEH